MNTFGKNFAVTTFGESHGPAVGAVIDGCPARLALSPADIQPLLDRRRPGTSPLMSARSESDTVEILSGVFEGQTTGAPIALLVRNRDVHSGDYEALREKFRPGHADFTYQEKYGIRDHRGGGRSSGRETVGRVAAGAVALKFLATKGIAVTGRIVSVHGKTGPREIEKEILAAKAAGDSVGGIAEIVATGCPTGLGDPVFGKLDAAIAGAMMGIGAVKGVEIGDGFLVAGKFGSENNDQMTADRVFRQPCGRHSRRDLERSGDRCPYSSKTHAIDCKSPADPGYPRERGGNHRQRPARPLHRAPDPPGGRSDACARAHRCGAGAGEIPVTFFCRPADPRQSGQQFLQGHKLFDRYCPAAVSTPVWQ